MEPLPWLGDAGSRTKHLHVWMQTLPWMWLHLVLDKLLRVGEISANCYGWKTSTETEELSWAGGSSVCRAVGARAPGGDFSRVLDAVPGVDMCWSFKETTSKLFLLAGGRCFAVLDWLEEVPGLPVLAQPS